MEIDSNDDMGNAIRPFRVVAVIPVLGRLPLLKLTIERLYKKNKVYKVICVGHLPEDRKASESCGAVWVHHKNRPLGQKWNVGFVEAKRFSPDACLFVGSSDWISDNWIKELAPLMNQYDLIGTLGCHFLHVGNEENRLVFWPGYHKLRIGESIGIGRLISSRLLDKMQWKPFNDALDKSLDSSMQLTCILHAGSIHVLSNVIGNSKIHSVSISTDQWGNKHNFEDHWQENHPRYMPSIKLKPEQFITDHFPEANQIFQPKLIENEKDSTH